MSLGLNKTKRRIASITGTEKTTKAMELIATVKVKRFSALNDKTSRYSEEYASLMSEIFAHDTETGSHYGKINSDVDATLYIVIGSSLGLCGSYNNSLFRFAESVMKPNDYLAPIGQKAIHHFAREGKFTNVVHDFEAFSSDPDVEKVHLAMMKLKADFNAKKYRNIVIIFTRYINSISFAPTQFQLLPVQVAKKRWDNEEYCPPLFDESPRLLIHRFMDDYLTSVFYDRLLESQLSEQASRRTAMDNANDNADRLLDKLTIEYNKARQNAITSEITEVVAGTLGGDN